MPKVFPRPLVRVGTQRGPVRRRASSGPLAVALLLGIALLLAVPVFEEVRAVREGSTHHPGGFDTAVRLNGPSRITPAPRVRPAFGGESRLSVIPHDPADFPNNGLETNITGFAPQLLQPLTSFQVAVEETIGSYDAVFGLFQNASFGPIGFFEVFTSANDSTAHLAYGAPTATAPGVGYDFRLTESLRTEWDLTVNGAPFSVNSSEGSFNFGTANSTDPSGLAYSEVAFYQGSASAVVPASLTATTAVAVHEPGGRYLPHNATTTFVGGASSAWGVEGRDQVPSLAPGEIRSGTSLSPVVNGTTLWTGGPVPIDLTFTLSSETTTATLPILANALVKDGNGTPIAGVPLVIADARGGTQIGVGNATNSLGVSQLELLTPNVSAAGTDLVSVSSTILGYEGRTSEDLILTPAIEIELLASPADATVVTNGSIVLTFRSDAYGSAVAFTAIQFSTTFGGTLSLAYAQSGSDGSVSISFLAGPTPATVTVQALVVEPGAWGHGSVTVRVIRPPPDPWTESEPYVVLAILAAFVGSLIVLIRRRKVGRLPSLAILPDEPGIGETPYPEGAASPLSRTPPSGGSP